MLCNERDIALFNLDWLSNSPISSTVTPVDCTMSGRSFVVLLVSAILLASDLSQPGEAMTPTKTVDLFNFLFDSTFYNKNVRPVGLFNESLPILLQYDLFSISDVSQVIFNNI